VTVLGRQYVALIVDGDAEDVLVIRQVLARSGYARAVHVVTDGREALAFLRRTGDYAEAPRPDVMLLDLNVPGKDGRAVLTEMKADDHLSSIPVLVFTSSQDPADIRDSYAAHASVYIIKPAAPDEFSAVVGRIDEFFAQVAVLPPPAS
jgi:two-component system response regulator